jgi:hypothetical protein
LCWLKTQFLNAQHQSKERESKFPFLSLFQMAPKNKGKQSSETLLKRAATESMSSKAAASLLERAQDAAEDEVAEALLYVSAGSTARVADGRLMKASSGLDEEEAAPIIATHFRRIIATYFQKAIKTLSARPGMV